MHVNSEVAEQTTELRQQFEEPKEEKENEDSHLFRLVSSSR